jgi:hypothetical protein
MGWALSHIYRTHNEFVSKLGESGGGAALAQSFIDNAVDSVAIPGDDHSRLAFVPDDGRRQGCPRLCLCRRPAT